MKESTPRKLSRSFPSTQTIWPTTFLIRVKIAVKLTAYRFRATFVHEHRIVHRCVWQSTSQSTNTNVLASRKTYGPNWVSDIWHCARLLLASKKSSKWSQRRSQPWKKCGPLWCQMIVKNFRMAMFCGWYHMLTKLTKGTCFDSHWPHKWWPSICRNTRTSSVICQTFMDK